jgi:thiol:disulfide interchange protein
MAFPYFVLSAFPEVARRFPRAGAWGDIVKQFMGFLLLATAVYFAGPLITRFASLETIWWVIFAAVALGAVFLLVRGMTVSKTMVGRVAAAVVAILIFAPSLYAVRKLTAKPFEWTAFSPEVLEKARGDGKVVLVEFTAIWCGNCHWVETNVLKSTEIVKTVREHDIVMLKADVSRDDAPGWLLLRQFSPAGAIPLTVIYPSHADSPIQLTGIYKRAELKQALDQASRNEVATRTSSTRSPS